MTDTDPEANHNKLQHRIPYDLASSKHFDSLAGNVGNQLAR